MQARKFELFLKDLAALTRRQRGRLLGLLLPAVKLDQAVDLIERSTADRLACPGCGSRQFHRHGHANGLQRYRCRTCARTCNALTGTPLARLRHKGAGSITWAPCSIRTAFAVPLRSWVWPAPPAFAGAIVFWH